MLKLDEFMCVELHTGTIGNNSSATMLGTARDIGGCRSGLLVVNFEAGATSDISGFGLYGDPGSSTVTTADTLCEMVAAKYWTTASPTGPGTKITVSSNLITLPADSADILIVCQMAALQRYVKLVYICSTGSSDGHQLGVTLLATDNFESPVTAARSGY